MSKKYKLVEIWGGFHDQMIPIRVRVSPDFKITRDSLRDELSVDTFKRVQNHICGIKGCLCGGFYRANIEEVTK